MQKTTAGPAHHPKIAQSIDDIADLLELEAANPFRVRAYRNAARIVPGLGNEVSAVPVEGQQAPKLAGSGTDLADKIRTLASTGHLPRLDQVGTKPPHIAQELRKPPSLEPKQVRTRCEEPEVRTLEQLHRAVLVGGKTKEDVSRAEGLSDLRFGVGQSRRGRLEKDDVLNTRSLAELRLPLTRTMRR